MKVFGIFDYDWILTLPLLTGWLWASGGSGVKSLRRFGVPLAISLYAIGYKIAPIPLIVLLISTLGLIAFGPGYGDDYVKKLGSLYWFYVYLLGFLYGACQFALCIHFGHWLAWFICSISCGVVFSGTMYLSKKYGLPWKVCESLTGATLGLTATLIISSG